jgi:hypothetical protein
MLIQWRKEGGVLMIGYDMFRTLLSPGKQNRLSKQQRGHVEDCLADPGSASFSFEGDLEEIH